MTLRNAPFWITDAQVQEAFDVLHDGQHAKARAAYEYAEARIKVAFSKALLAVEGKTASEREAMARVSEAYQAALKEFHLIAERYHSARDKRDAASAVIDAYRTQAADRRQLGKVA